MRSAPSDNPDLMTVSYLTAPATAFAVEEGQRADASHSGLYRDPLPQSDGRLVASHSAETRADRNEGSTEARRSRYDFRLRLLSADAGGTFRAGEALTPGLRKAVSWYDPDTLVSHDGPLWELNAVELRPRARPARRSSVLPAPERQVFAEEGVDVAAFQADLRRNGLALMDSRNVTLRDKADRQQPYKLRIRGGVSAVPAGGKAYDVSHLQFFQGDQIRGIGGAAALAADGSVAALIQAQRAKSWQLTNGAQPVVRERYWISFQNGEIRDCASCHGINQRAQTGAADSTSPPEDLRRLLRLYKAGMALSDTDRVFNWAERRYPDHFLPKNAATASAQGYTYRHYPASGEYLGVKDGKVHYFKPADMAAPQEVGPLQPFVDAARQAGY